MAPGHVFFRLIGTVAAIDDPAAEGFGGIFLDLLELRAGLAIPDHIRTGWRKQFSIPLAVRIILWP